VEGVNIFNFAHYLLYRLRGTIAGAYNRLDLLSLVTCGVDENDMSNGTEDIVAAVDGWQENETHDPDIPAVSHRRGMQPFVFIPFEEVMDLTFFTVIYHYALHLLVLDSNHGVESGERNYMWRINHLFSITNEVGWSKNIIFWILIFVSLFILCRLIRQFLIFQLKRWISMFQAEG